MWFLERVKTSIYNTSGLSIFFLCLAAGVIAANTESLSFIHDYINNIDIALLAPEHILPIGLKDIVNSTIISIIFFIIGLELKRSYHAGDFKDYKNTALAFFISIGGIVAPFIVFYVFNNDFKYHNLWIAGIETDTAIVICLLQPFRKFLPIKLYSFICLIAIFDDIIGLTFINYMYASHINMTYVTCLLGVILFLFAVNKLNLHSKVYFYVAVPLACIFCELAGVHCTLAALACALFVPNVESNSIENANKKLNDIKYLDKGVNSLNYDKKVEFSQKLAVSNREHNFSYISALDNLQHIVNYLLLPIFIFINTDISLSREKLSAVYEHAYAFSIFLQLLSGKFIGTAASAFLGVTLGFGALPKGVSFRSFLSICPLFGAGFTFSFYILELMLSNPDALETAKLSVFIASTVSIIVGMVVLEYNKRKLLTIPSN